MHSEKMIRTAIGGDIYYPHNPEALRACLQNSFRKSTTPPGEARVVVAPFGEYHYVLPYLSMSMRACSLNQPELVYVIAPPNDNDSEHALLPEAEAFETPLGELPVATDVIEELSEIPALFRVDEFAHLANHSIELLLPPLHYLFGAVPIVPILLGRVPTANLAALVSTIHISARNRPTITILGANVSGFASAEETNRRSRQITRLLMTSPGTQILTNLTTMDNPVRSLGALVVGHILAGPHARPAVLGRNVFTTNYQGETHCVAFVSIAYV